MPASWIEIHPRVCSITFPSAFAICPKHARFMRRRWRQLDAILLHQVKDEEGKPTALGWGRLFPELWINVPLDGREAMPSNGAHVALFAADKAAVDLFHSVALSLEAVTMAPRDIVENINPATMRRSFAIRTGTN